MKINEITVCKKKKVETSLVLKLKCYSLSLCCAWFSKTLSFSLPNPLWLFYPEEKSIVHKQFNKNELSLLVNSYWLAHLFLKNVRSHWYDETITGHDWWLCQGQCLFSLEQVGVTLTTVWISNGIKSRNYTLIRVAFLSWNWTLNLNHWRCLYCAASAVYNVVWFQHLLRCLWRLLW